MKYKFKDTSDDTWYEFHETLPENTREYKVNINLAALTLFGLYRKTIYVSYGAKPDLAQDIKEFNSNPEHISHGRVIDKDDSLNSYAIYGSLSAIKEIAEQKAKCYIAYQKDSNGWPKKIGFASFREATIDGKPVVYICSAGVRADYVGKGIGRRLMECILAHYPENTEFYILTRRFNSEAITLYRDRFNFEPISIEQIRQLEYDERYVGFKRKMTGEELVEINNKREDISSELSRSKLSVRA